jgi:hypothetical protein
MIRGARMQRFTFLAGLSAAVATIEAGATCKATETVAGILFPDSTLANEATAIAQEVEHPQIFAHSLRTFLFAKLFARASGVEHDAEALYVASILHDVGLSPKHMSDSRRFEVDGAFAAADLCRRHAVPPERTALIWDAVALHDQNGIAKWKQPEVALVSAGVGADFGANLDKLNRSDVSAVLEAAPRAGFVPIFLSTVAEYVRRKPFATGNSWITDIGYRMVQDFHLANFVDQVQLDPFVGY